MSSAATSQEQVLAALQWPGADPAKVCLVGREDDGGLAIALWHPDVGVRTVVIEDDELYGACCAYLRDSGARQFNSFDEMANAAGVEEWPC